MTLKPEAPPAAVAGQRDIPTIDRDQNISAVVDFYLREEQKLSRSQRALERASHFVGRPLFMVLILVFVAAWIGANLLLRHLGRSGFDPPPFPWLQGMVGLSALLAATVVLTKQTRLARLEKQRAHLDLKVTLLTEQKTAKLIDLLEELRRDLPNVRDRHDPEALELQQPMNPDLVLAALSERGGPTEPSVPGGADEMDVPAAAPCEPQARRSPGR